MRAAAPCGLISSCRGFLPFLFRDDCRTPAALILLWPRIFACPRLKAIELMESNPSAQLERAVAYLQRDLERVLDRKSVVGERAALAEGDGNGPYYLWYPSKSASPRPAVIHVHGGGFALGDPRKADSMCQWIRDAYDVNVAAVGYRRTPDFKFPCGAEDVRDTVLKLAACCQELGVDAGRIYLMGFSAGACLALSAALMLQELGSVQPAGLLLHYPFVDAATDPDEIEAESEDLPKDMQRLFNAWYVGDADSENPLVSPLRATDFQLLSLPKTVVATVQGDVLQASGAALYRRMEALGCEATLFEVPGAYHGYIEDAADLPTLVATSTPSRLAAKGAAFVDVAAKAMRSTLDDLLGFPVNPLPFPSEGLSALRAALTEDARG